MTLAWVKSRCQHRLPRKQKVKKNNPKMKEQRAKAKRDTSSRQVSALKREQDKIAGEEKGGPQDKITEEEEKRRGAYETERGQQCVQAHTFHPALGRQRQEDTGSRTAHRAVSKTLPQT